MDLLIGIVAVALLLAGGRAIANFRAGAAVWLVGDSLAQGLDRPLRAELPRLTWTSETRVGETTAGLTPARRDAIKRARPAAVLLSYGTNDAAAPDPRFRDAFPERARAIVQDLSSAGVRVYWIAPPAMPFADYARIRKGIWDSGASVIFPPRELERGPDGIHPTATAYRRWAAEVARQFP